MVRLILLFYVTFLCLRGSSQDVLYSAPVGNYSYADFKIVGRVGKNVVVYNYVWSHTFDRRKSDILIYDDKMVLQHKISLRSIVARYSSVDFINEVDSFSAIIQYIEDSFFVCKLVSFDAHGKILNSQLLQHAPAAESGPFEIVRSAAGKSFALLNVPPSKNNTTITIQYHFVKNNILIHSDKIVLPFNRFSSGLDKAVLDDSNLIIPINDNTNSLGRLAVYKVDLTNNSRINSIRSLIEGHLVSASVSVNKDDTCYTVLSEWKDETASKIFLWQLDKDLTDVCTDTVFNKIDSISPCVQNMRILNLRSVALKNRTTNIIFSYGNTGDPFTYHTGHYYARPDPHPIPTYYSPISTTGGYSGGGGFYEGRVLSFMPLKELNGNGREEFADVVHGPTWGNSTAPNYDNYREADQAGRIPYIPKNGYPIARLGVVNIDSRNNLNWAQCFDESVEKDFKSLVNLAAIINMPEGLHFIYSKTLKNGKQALSDIVLKSDGTYRVIPIISMSLDYLYFVSRSSQIDSNTIVVPCASNGKLAFAKIKLDQSW